MTQESLKSRSSVRGLAFPVLEASCRTGWSMAGRLSCALVKSYLNRIPYSFASTEIWLTGFWKRANEPRRASAGLPEPSADCGYVKENQHEDCPPTMGSLACAESAEKRAFS